MARKPRRTDVCPHCGAEFREGRPACPECGSDVETGWSREGLTGEAHGLPDEFTDRDYDDVLRDIGALPPASRFPAWVVIAGLIGVLAFVLAFVL